MGGSYIGGSTVYYTVIVYIYNNITMVHDEGIYIYMNPDK